MTYKLILASGVPLAALAIPIAAVIGFGNVNMQVGYNMADKVVQSSVNPTSQPNPVAVPPKDNNSSSDGSAKPKAPTPDGLGSGTSYSRDVVDYITRATARNDQQDASIRGLRTNLSLLEGPRVVNANTGIAAVASGHSPSSASLLTRGDLYSKFRDLHEDLTYGKINQNQFNERRNELFDSAEKK